MAHYSQLDDDNIVIQVVVISDADENGTEENGIAFCQSLFGADTVWKKTSFNTFRGEHLTGGTPFRLNYGAVGDTYNEENDAFYRTSEPKPFPSWIIDTSTGMWTHPVAMPTDDPQDGYHWDWDESTTSWIQTPVPDTP